MEMALSLSKPHLRSQMESNMRAICEGQKSKEVVVSEGLHLYKEAFMIAEAQETKLFQVGLLMLTQVLSNLFSWRKQ